MAKYHELLNEELKNRHSSWSAKETPQSLLSDALKINLLGAVPNDEGQRLINESKIASIHLMTEIKSVGIALPGSVDWRTGGHVTSVKDQANCGSCVSFGSIATIESMAHIEVGKSLDLSEADSHFCSNHGANCTGWWPSNALDQAKIRGISPESDFPYASAFPGNNPYCSNGGGYCHVTCIIPANRNTRVVTITNWSSHDTMDDRKSYLSQVGPMIGCFDVYDDFFAYSTGVYHHVSGPLKGGHCVQIIGYSDDEGCWICKNSWSDAWGDQGYFKMKYGECKMDTNPFFGCTGIIVPADV